MWIKKFSVLILIVFFANPILADETDPDLGLSVTSLNSLLGRSDVPITFRNQREELRLFFENFSKLKSYYYQPAGYFLKSSAISLAYCSEPLRTRLSVLYVVVEKKSYAFAIFGIGRGDNTGIEECKNMANEYTNTYQNAQEDGQIIGIDRDTLTAKGMLYVPKKVYILSQNKNVP